MEKREKFQDFQSAMFIGDGQPHRTNQEQYGTVVIFFADGTQKHFKHIRRGEYWTWVRSGYNYRKAPSGVFYAETASS
jgi:hypothetical protein